MSEQKPQIALVIGSGSVKCAAAIGVWRVLAREGINLNMVVGCSGGSMYAALIALGVEVAEAERLTKELWTSDLVSSYTSNLKAVRSGEVEFNERSGLVGDEEMNKRLSAAFGDRSFAEARIPLQIVATDIRKGEKVIMSEGRLFDAIRASIAIPLVFPPWEVDGHLLTDGAVCDPLPVDVAIKEGAQIILALGFDLPYRARMRSMDAVQSQLNAIYINNILRATYAFYNLAHHAEIIPLLPDFEKNIGNFDTHLFPHIIAKGEEVAEAQLPYLKRLLEGTRTEL